MIYIASKIKHGIMLREWAKEAQLRTTSRWLDMIDFEREAQPADFAWCWLIDDNDVKDARFLLVYAERNDTLCGALVEVGMALGQGKIVVAVGEGPSFGSWQHHPQVIRTSNLDQASKIIKEYR